MREVNKNVKQILANQTERAIFPDIKN